MANDDEVTWGRYGFHRSRIRILTRVRIRVRATYHQYDEEDRKCRVDIAEDLKPEKRRDPREYAIEPCKLGMPMAYSQGQNCSCDQGRHPKHSSKYYSRWGQDARC